MSLACDLWPQRCQPQPFGDRGISYCKGPTVMVNGLRTCGMLATFDRCKYSIFRVSCVSSRMVAGDRGGAPQIFRKEPTPNERRLETRHLEPRLQTGERSFWHPGMDLNHTPLKPPVSPFFVRLSRLVMTGMWSGLMALMD